MADETLTDIWDRLRRIPRKRKPRPARLLAAAVLVLAVSACAEPAPPNPDPQPVVREWLSTEVRNISTVCLFGDRLYGNTSSGAIAVAPGGCR